MLDSDCVQLCAAGCGKAVCSALMVLMAGCQSTLDPQDNQPIHTEFMSLHSSSSYLVGAASLSDLLDKQICVLLHDGRYLIGILRSYDQYLNLVLHHTRERFVSTGQV